MSIQLLNRDEIDSLFKANISTYTVRVILIHYSKVEEKGLACKEVEFQFQTSVGLIENIAEKMKTLNLFACWYKSFK